MLRRSRRLKWISSRFSAVYSPTGMLTSPKLMLPFQMDRAIVRPPGRTKNARCMPGRRPGVDGNLKVLCEKPFRRYTTPHGAPGGEHDGPPPLAGGAGEGRGAAGRGRHRGAAGDPAALAGRAA